MATVGPEPTAPLTRSHLIEGCRSFQQHEQRDAMYRVASDLIERTWDDLTAVADALGVLLLTWNQAFYRYGDLDFNDLEGFLCRHQQVLQRYRSRNLLTLVDHDEPLIRNLFDDLLEASRSRNRKTGAKHRSPVSVAKALHLLGPNFFPLWDDKIAVAFGCRWQDSSRAFAAYMTFMRKTKQQLESLGSAVERTSIERELCEQARFAKPLLKFLDENNYARFTQDWIPSALSAPEATSKAVEHEE